MAVGVSFGLRHAKRCRENAVFVGLLEFRRAGLSSVPELHEKRVVQEGG